jgi:hypothetical protein
VDLLTKRTELRGLAERILNVREDDLEREWCEHPDLFYRFALHLAEERRELDDAKAHLELTEAQMERDVRLHPEKYGFEKITEAVVKAAVCISKNYQVSLKDYNDQKHAVNVAQVAVEMMEHRKKMLENRVQLMGLHYRSSPRAAGAEMAAAEETRRRGTRKAGEGMRREA